MRLFEIVDLEKTRQTKGNAYQGFADMPGEELSAGNVEAIVKAHDKDPNKVNKFLPVTETTLNFLKVIQQNQGNPFFPKLFHAKRFVNKEGNETLFVQMERLQEVDDFDWREHGAELFKQIGIDIDPKTDFRNLIWSVKVFDEFDGPKKRAALVQKSDNPQFKQAMAALEPLIRATGSDMRGENFMIRPGTGELVIIDPLDPFGSEYTDTDSDSL